MRIQEIWDLESKIDLYDDHTGEFSGNFLKQEEVTIILKALKFYAENQSFSKH